MAIRFRILTESDVKSVLTMDDLIETMASALKSFSTKRVEQPVRAVLSVDGNRAFFGTMPAYVRAGDASAALGAKLVTVFEQNHAKGLPSHLASILLLDPETGALKALLDGRYITEARTAAVSAVSSRLLARKNAKSLAIIGSGVQARSHLEALSRVHTLKQVTVWSPNKAHREKFVANCLGSDPTVVRGQTPRHFGGRPPRRGSGGRRRRRPRHLVARTGHRKRLDKTGRPRDFGRRLPAESA